MAYDYIFDEILYKNLKYDIKPLVESDKYFEMGVYDCELGDAYFLGKEALDEELQFLKATCSLPIAGKIVEYNGKNIWMVELSI